MNYNIQESSFQNIIKKYLAFFPEENEKLKLIQEQLEKQNELRPRNNFRPHYS